MCSLAFVVVADVKMPRVDVGVAMLVIFQVIPMATLMSSIKPGWIELLGEFPHVLHPILRPRDSQFGVFLFLNRDGRGRNAGGDA